LEDAVLNPAVDAGGEDVAEAAGVDEEAEQEYVEEGEGAG
jgi:hypothetical protein